MKVPNGWKSSFLGEISEFVTSGSRDWAKYYSASGSKFIRMTNLTRGGIYLDQAALKYVDVKSDSADGKRTSLQPSDILISITAELGKIGWVPDDIGEAYINQHTALVRPKNIVDSKFIAYQLSSHKLNNTINRLNDSGAKAGLNLPTVRKIPILLPPLPEQNAIADLLSTWDSAIEKTERLIAAKKKRFQWLLDELIFVPAKSGIWEEYRLGDVSQMSSGGTPKSSIAEYYDGGIVWVSIADMTKQGKFIDYSARTLSDIGVENSSAKVFPKGTVFYAMYASIGEVSIANIDASTSQAILGIVVGEKLENEFLYFYLLGQKKRIKLQGQSGTQSNLNAQMVKDFWIPIPSIEEQINIVNSLNAFQKEIDLLKSLAEKYKEQKRGLMQKLLTGEWRVKVEG